MVIPNREVKSIYRTTVMQWCEEKVNANSREDLFEALISSDVLRFADTVRKP